MTFKPFKGVPACLAAGVILAVCFVQWLRPNVSERLEDITFDMRVRQALGFHSPIATNLGFVYINEESIRDILDGSLGYRFGLYWPRQIYGYVVHELAAQHARAVALDILFGELRPDHPLVAMADGGFIHSDDFFAQELARASNVVLAVTHEVTPPPLFLTNAAAAGDISTDKDSDGILRRAKAYRDYRVWNPAFRQVEADPQYGIDLRKAKIERHRIVLPRSNGEVIVVPLDAEGNFDLADFGGEDLPAGTARKSKPFIEQRAWHMGIVLAARELGLDLGRAEVDLKGGRITLRGPAGLERVVPVDARGYFYIDWRLPANHPALLAQPIQQLLAEHRRRLQGGPAPPDVWRDKLVLIGSAAAQGNDLTDRGATPLEPDTLLISEHWNVANSFLTNSFVRRASLPVELALIILLGFLAALFTWSFRALTASASVALLAVAYVVAAFALYIQTRYWIPIVLPVMGALLMTHVCMVTWRVVFEQADKRRVRSIFSTIVSPKIVNELLQAQTLSLGGARREVTVLFADVRGFTEFTENSQERMADYVRQQGLRGAEAEACFDRQARETLQTINLYLGLVADAMIRGDGTLDKFIGDCVMAFWGAPTSNPSHARTCVHAAIEAQRATFELNRRRRAENERRLAENCERAKTGLPELSLLPLLELGTGINTGLVTVGLMGSEAKTRNYTVFGRDVNLASRLESLSGRARILISQTTYDHLLRDEPALAATCIRLEPVNVKGFRSKISAFEVPWQTPAPAASLEAPATPVG